MICAANVCGTERGRVSEVCESRYTGSSSGNSWLLSAQVRNLHCYLSKIDIVRGKKKKEDKTKEDFSLRCLSDTHVGQQQGQNMFSLMLRHPELTVGGTHSSVSAFMSALCRPPTTFPIVFAFHPER